MYLSIFFVPTDLNIILFLSVKKYIIIFLSIYLSSYFW